MIEEDGLAIRMGPAFDFRDLVQAHAPMDSNQAGGKIVIRLA